MFSTLLWLPLAAALPSLLGRADSSCSYSQNFSIEVSGYDYAQQIEDGQVVTGNGTNCLTLQISSSGEVTDQSGRECYISKPQMQFQCESSPPSAVVSSSSGFCVSDNLFTFNGKSTFYSCDTGNGTRNLYTQSVNSMACKKVTVNVVGENCQPAMTTSSCPSPSTVTKTSTVISTEQAQTVVKTETNTVTASAQTVVNTQTATVTASAQTVVKTATVTQSAQTVVNTVTAKAQTVTATVTTEVTKEVTQQAETVTQEETQKAQTVTQEETVTQQAQTVTQQEVKTEAITMAPKPSSTTCSPTTTLYPSTIIPVATGQSYGPSFFLSAGNGNTSYITYNIPSSVSGTCYIDLQAPSKNQLQTSNYDFSGSGQVKICVTDSAATDSTTSKNAPSNGKCFSKSVSEGQGTINFGSIPCPSGQANFSVSTTGSLHIMMFEDYNPPPVGIVLAAC